MYIWRDTIALSDTTDTTAYSSNPYNGFLHMIMLTTSATCTGSLGSTGVLKLWQEKAGTTAPFAQIPIGTFPMILYPRTGVASSSGGATNGLSTGGPYWADRFALFNERLLVQTVGGSTISTGWKVTLTFVVEGSRF